MLVDKVQIEAQSGKGGRGSHKMFSYKPYGGDGGRGGDIVFVGSMNMYDLRSFDPNSKLKAEHGGDGQVRGMKGKDAMPLVIKVPLTTEISINDKVVGIVSAEGQSVTVLKGGIGGWGNVSTKKDMTKLGTDAQRENQTAILNLQLKLSSDVIFLGYPNAGKSSMLNELTNAGVKTAPYAFTTLDPQVGIMDGLKLMDLPGLIDGTHEGKGLGTSFLNHVQRSKLALHFVALDIDDPFSMYSDMRAEVRLISEILFKIPEIVVLTKYDEVNQEKIDSVVKKFSESGVEVIVTSIVDDQSVLNLKKLIKTKLKK
jgi:GTP-binding protein